MLAEFKDQSKMTVKHFLCIYWISIIGMLPLTGIAQTNSDTTKLPFKSAVKVGLDTIPDTTLYRVVDQWLGTPYKYGGQDTTGTDCSGLTGQIYKKCYLTSLPRSASDIYKKCQPVAKDSLTPGELVFFKIEADKISHVGVYLGNGKFVHASKQSGVVISDLSLSYYQEHFFKGGRIEDIE